jgi:hypothetical protein
MQGQDIALLLKLAILNEPQVPSKSLAESLFISPSEVSKALKRCADSGLLYLSSGEKRVNRSAYWRMVSLPQFGRMRQERFEECRLPRSIRERPKPRCSIQTFIAFSLSATQSAVEERGNVI